MGRAAAPRARAAGLALELLPGGARLPAAQSAYLWQPGQRCHHMIMRAAVVALSFLELPIATGEPSVLKPAPADSQYLLANPSAVVAAHSAHLVVGRAERLGRPLLGEERPWDVDWGNAYPNVAFDAAVGKYKLWWGGPSRLRAPGARLRPRPDRASVYALRLPGPHLPVARLAPAAECHQRVVHAVLRREHGWSQLDSA